MSRKNSADRMSKFEMHFIGRLTSSDTYTAQFLKRIKSLEAEGWARHSGEMPTNELIRHFDSATALVRSFSFPSEGGVWIGGRRPWRAAW